MITNRLTHLPSGVKIVIITTANCTEKQYTSHHETVSNCQFPFQYTSIPPHTQYSKLVKREWYC